MPHSDRQRKTLLGVLNRDATGQDRQPAGVRTSVSAVHQKPPPIAAAIAVVYEDPAILTRSVVADARFHPQIVSPIDGSTCGDAAARSVELQREVFIVVLATCVGEGSDQDNTGNCNHETIDAGSHGNLLSL
jgi:hypothetical protein